MIKGGYILQPRKIQDSAVAKMPPCSREVWAWILRNAFFADSGNLKRGQLFANIDEIRDDLKWFVGFIKNTYTRRQIEGAYEGLRKEGMIVTKKVAHGLVITVCKYEYYQSIKNYEGYNEGGEKKIRRSQGREKEVIAINKEDLMNYKESNTIVTIHEKNKINGTEEFIGNNYPSGEHLYAAKYSKRDEADNGG
jgi:hypothetical protein